MGRAVPTVRIVNPAGGFLTINQQDFDPTINQLFDGGPVVTSDPTPTPSNLPPIEARLAELQALADAGDWRSLKVEAESHGITRPADGWDAAVLPILVAEYGQAAVDEVV